MGRRKDTKTGQMDFGDGTIPKEKFQQFEKIITDRKSVYSVSIGLVNSRDEIKDFLIETKKGKNHHKATHHTWAVRIARDGVIYESKNDDGETGAGNVVLRILQKKNMINTVVCVTRWFGGVKLEADRFKHVQDASIYAVKQVI